MQSIFATMHYTRPVTITNKILGSLSYLLVYTQFMCFVGNRKQHSSLSYYSYLCLDIQMPATFFIDIEYKIIQ